MDLVIKYLEAHRESILMDLELIKNDTKTRYAIEKRKQLEPMLKQFTRAVEILSSVLKANDNIPLVNTSFDEDDDDEEELLGYECMSCGNIQGGKNGFGCNRCSAPLTEWYG